MSDLQLSTVILTQLAKKEQKKQYSCAEGSIRLTMVQSGHVSHCSVPVLRFLYAAQADSVATVL